MTEVAAAILRDEDAILICQRPAHKACPLLWEFPGGKLEAGETLAECLARECKEELHVDIQVYEQFGEVTYTYPDVTVHLTFFVARIIGGALVPTEHQAVRWVSPAEIAGYTFCPADLEIVERLSSNLNNL